MKKTAVLFLALSLCLVLSACRNTDFVNLSSFIDTYNSISDENGQIDFSALIIEKNENKEIASFFPDGTYKIAVRLENNEVKQIGEARIVLRKTDKNGNPIELSENDLNRFLVVCNQTVFALSNCAVSEVPQSIRPASVSDLKVETEKTAESPDYYYIYYSNSLVSVVIIRNNKLKQTETTKKPENKEPFAQMTETRENTVPHK
ncbi:MAG: hypothetical protein ACI4XE_12200 [Acutalibacteraceae bacterium]